MDIIIIKHTKSACLAQPVEHAAVNRSVGGSSPSTGAIERNRIAVSFLFLSFSSNPLTLFSPCTTSACRSVGENMLFRRALRSLRGSSPLAGAIVAARRTSQHLAQQRGVFACMPALNPTENSFGGDPDAPLRVAKMQDVRCAPRSCGTIAPLSHFCSAGRLRRGFFFLLFCFLSLAPPDAVFALHDSRVQISWRKHAIPSRLALLTGVEPAGRRHRRRKANFATPRATARGVCMYACAKPHRKFFRRGPRFMPHRKFFRRGPLCSSSRRKNARRSLCSSFLRNYRAALSFLLRGAASPRFLFFFYRSPRSP